MPRNTVDTVIHPFATPEQLELIRTPPIKFIVGRENAEFHLQPGLVSRLSTQMDALIRSGVTGPDGVCVTWDIDADVFLRLVQFIFTGSYTCLVSELDKSTEIDIMSGSGPFATETFKLPYSLASYDLGVKTRSANQHDSSPLKSTRKRKSGAICCCDCVPPDTRKSLISAFMSTYIHGHGGLVFKPEPITQIDEALLCHVRMWLFAEEYAIKQLADVASFRLAYELAHWTILATTFIPTFSKLVQHTYAVRKIEAGSLRQLIASYAACVVEDIAVLEGWEALLQGVPGFTLDLVQQMIAHRSSWDGGATKPPTGGENRLFGQVPPTDGGGLFGRRAGQSPQKEGCVFSFGGGAGAV